MSKSGYVGVGLNNSTGKYRVWISDLFFDGFLTLEDAIAFRKVKELELGFSEQHFKRSCWNES